MDTNVIEINRTAESAKRIRTKLDRWRSASNEWIEATLDLAAELWEARRQHASDPAFGAWLAENELDDLGKNDRAALICMGQDLGWGRCLLENTSSRSPRYIWSPKPLSLNRERGIAPVCSEKSTESELPPSSSNEVISETSEIRRRHEPEHQKNAISRRSPFYGFPRAEEVTGVYQSTDMRTVIGRAINCRGGKQIWDLILSVIDAGFLVPTNTTVESPSLRVLFPAARPTYCRQFDLTKPENRQHVRNVILPAAIACKEALLANPENFDIIVGEYLKRQAELQREEAAAKQLQRQLSVLPSDEQEIIMFGQRLWPRPSGELYGYKELRSGIWAFRDLDLWLDKDRDPSETSRALMMRHIVGTFHAYARHELEGDNRAKMEKVFGVVSKLSRLYAQSPSGECKFPSPPKREDEW